MKLFAVLLLALFAGACTYVPITGNASGNQPDVVMVCHKGKQELELPSNAAAEHRKHGDTYGRCR